MPLVKTSDLLRHATRNRYGVAAVNTFNYETVKWVVQAAEAEQIPVIVQLYPGYEFHIPPAYIAHMAKDLAVKSTAYVAVHLDHSTGYDIAVAGIRDGFPSVMIDGSTLPFEENVAVTQAVVKTARVFGVDVEAELGHVGSGSNIDDITDSERFTNPDQAALFADQTGCGSLAVAVGNAHGPYARKPNLDFDRIQAIRERVSIPLVLHGCSGIPDDQMRRAVALGMCKFNVATEYFRATADAMRGAFDKGENDASRLFFNLGEQVMAFLREKMRLLNESRVNFAP